MSGLFHAIFFDPLYNALVFLAAVLPGHNVAWAVIVLTLTVKLLLFPLQHRMSRTQQALRQLEPELKRLKDRFSKDQVEQARQVMALYRAHGLNPFSGFVLILIQIPILLALFLVFQRGFDFKPELLYSFIAAPPLVETRLFGLIDIAGKSYLLAIAAGLAQFIQTWLAPPPGTPTSPGAGGGRTFGQDLARSMQLQARYVLPVLVVVFALGLPAAIALYWVTSSVFTVGHEWWVRRQASKLLP